MLGRTSDNQIKIDLLFSILFFLFFRHLLGKIIQFKRKNIIYIHNLKMKKKDCVKGKKST